MRRLLALVLGMAMVLSVFADPGFALNTTAAAAASVGLASEESLRMLAGVGAVGVGLDPEARSAAGAALVYSRYDLDRDLSVGISDLSLLASNYGQRNSTYDLNGDSLIDLYDLVSLARQLFLTEAKSAAHAAVARAYAAYSMSDYTAEDWTVLVGIRTAGDMAIDAALDADELVLARDAAIAGMAGIRPLITITSGQIAGVIAPQTDDTPVTAASETAEYTAVVAWDLADEVFAASTAYTATITIMPKPGYRLLGVPANFFTVPGATATNTADSGVVTAVFPATSHKHRLSASAFQINLSTGVVSGSLSAGTHGTLDLRGQSDDATIVSLTFEAPSQSSLDLLSVTSPSLGQIQVDKHLDTLTVTMEQLLSGPYLGPVTLKLMRDVFGGSITLSGIVSHPDYLSAAATLTVVLK